MQQPAHDVLASPFWQVQAVYDTDGTGQDFAYTIGLFERGLPELHLWARPSLGEDPGEDWKFSCADRCRVLNELGSMLAAGRLDIGDELVHEYDGGLARITFRVDPPGDREELEAYGIAPGALVLPVRWSLQREPEGPLVPLTPEAESRARAAFRELVAELDPRRRAPQGWSVPDEPCFSPDQRFGPLTPLVLARAARLWQADDTTLSHLLEAGALANHGNSMTGPITMATALARPVGRKSCLAALLNAGLDLVEHLTDRPAARARWRRVVSDAFPDLWAAGDEAERRNMCQSYAGLLSDVVLSCLMVEAVADVADAPLLLEARGPWVSGTRCEPVITDPAWRAAPHVLEVVRSLLAPLDADSLSEVAGIHAYPWAREDGHRYGEVCARLQSWALTSAAACPWSPVLGSLPGWRELLVAFPGAAVARMPELESLGTCLASALVHRQWLTADDVTTLTEPLAAHLPQLRTALDAPL